jgi:hypothetical protein
MDARKTGVSMIVVGIVAQVVGIAIELVQNGTDAADRLFDLSRFPHALFFSGLALAVLGVVMLVIGPALYSAKPPTPARRLAQGLVPIVALATVAGCAAAANTSKLATGKASSGGGNVAAASNANAANAGATPTTAHNHGTVVAASNGSTPCEKALPTAASPGELGTGDAGSSAVTKAALAEVHGGRGLVQQAPLTRTERTQLEAQMVQARTVIDKYPTVKDAEAAGYGKSTPYVPCIGAHYTNLKLIFRFDPAVPSELLYDGTAPDSKIVGLSYLVWHPNGPPDGFAGPNDHWHQHNANGGLCLKGGQVVGGEDTTDAQCTARGGKKSGNIMKDIWMVHAWVAPGWECTWGAFSGECPELGGKIGADAWTN